MSKLTDQDIRRKMASYYDEGNSDNRNWRTRAKTAYGFYNGTGQWEKGDLQILESEGRPALTENQILPIVNLVSGFQRQNRQQVKVYPRKGGNAPAAEMLTELCKHTQDVTNAEFEQSMMFLDGYIGGKGWIELGKSFRDDPFNGELTIERRSPFEIIEDPNAKEYDLNKTAKYIIRTFWWDKEAIKMNYPSQSKEIGGALESLENAEGQPDVQTVETETYQEEGKMEGADPKKYRYRIKETWWKNYEKRVFLININNLEMKLIHETKMDMVAQLMAKARQVFNPKDYRIKEIVIPVLHQTITAGSLILENNTDPNNGVMTYPLFRFCPYWVDGYVFGGVENLEDYQREINKRASQMLHHLNQSANSGWFGPDGWEVESKKDVENFGSKAGVNLHYKEGKKPERIVPAPLSQGHLILKNEAEAGLKKTSGVNADLLGYEKGQTESGVAMVERKRQGLIATEIVFDNFNYTMQIFNTALCDVIRKTNVYSDEEIMAIVEDRHLEDKINIETLRTFKFGKYGIKVSQNPNLPTTRMANFESLLKAIQAGLPISPEHLIELSDLPNKQKILEDLRIQKQMLQQQQAGGAPQGAPSPLPQGNR